MWTIRDLPGLCAAVAVMLWGLLGGAAAMAQDSPLSNLRATESLTIIGGEFSVRNRFVTLTQIYAAGEAGFDAPGLRYRIQGGGGSYGGDPIWTPKYAAETMLGYAWWQDDYGITAYGGWAASHHDSNPGSLQYGVKDGPAALAEAWWRVTGALTLSAWARYEDPYAAFHGGAMAEQSVTDHWSLLAVGRGGRDDAGEYWAAEGGIGYRFDAPLMMIGPPREQALRLLGGVSDDGSDTDLSIRFELHLWNRD